MHSSLLCLGASLGASLVTSVIAAPSFTYVRHEKRNSLPFGWERDKMISGHAVLPMRVALSQSNLDKAEEYLMEVSHPDSPDSASIGRPNKLRRPSLPSKNQSTQ